MTPVPDPVAASEVPGKVTSSVSETLNPGAISDTWAAWATGSTAELTAALPPQPLSASTSPGAAQTRTANNRDHGLAISRHATAGPVHRATHRGVEVTRVSY